jgi:anti-sigma B factor antagonist
MTADGVQVRWMGEQAVVTMPAEVDALSADAVRQALFAEAGRSPSALIIDMSATTFCDSAGVQVIVDIYKRIAPTGTRLLLVVTAVRRIFTLVGMDQLVPVYPTLKAALADAAATPPPS